MSMSTDENDLKGLFYKDILEDGDNSNDIKQKLIYVFVKKLIEFLKKSSDKNEKIINFHQPNELDKKIDFNLPDAGLPLDQICDDVNKVLHYVIKTDHPRFFNQLWAGIDTCSLMGEWITAATNTSMYTYEVAPVYILMEKYVIGKMLSMASFENGDGMLFPGGSVSNITAVSLARYRFCPDFKEKGMFGSKPLVLFMSEEAHYSTVKAAATLGFGTNNVVKVKTDDRGRMVPSELEKAIQETLAKGLQPLYVCATAGCTTGGAFDPFNEIADMCEKYKLWMHIDAAWGGSVLISKKHKHLMDGCHRADSITWDAHKMLSVTLTCSVLLVKQKGLMTSCNQYGASYLFQPDRMYDPFWDSGDKTIQCGRRTDILKLWLMWRAKGTNCMEEQVDTAFFNAKYFSEEIKKRKGRFVLVREPEYTNICFYYIPPSLRNLPDGEDKNQKLHKVAPEIKKRMVVAGTLMVTYQPMKHIFNVFRMVCVNPRTKTYDLDFVLDEIERLGNDI